MFSADDLTEPLGVVLAAREGLTRRAVLDEGYSPGALLWVVASGEPRDFSAELRCGPRALGCVRAKLESPRDPTVPMLVLHLESQWYEDR